MAGDTLYAVGAGDDALAIFARTDEGSLIFSEAISVTGINSVTVSGTG